MSVCCMRMCIYIYIYICVCKKHRNKCLKWSSTSLKKTAPTSVSAQLQGAHDSQDQGCLQAAALPSFGAVSHPLASLETQGENETLGMPLDTGYRFTCFQIDP